MSICSTHSNSNFTHHILAIDHSSRCKLEAYITTHIKEKNHLREIDIFLKIGKAMKVKRVRFELECLLLILINSSLEFKVTCKNAELKCPYIRTHTKEKPSKISNITFVILPSYQKRIFKLNGHPEYFGIYFSCWNHQMCFNMVHFK